MVTIHTPGEMLTILLAKVGTSTAADEPSDGPPVRVIAQADLDAKSNADCDRWERFMERDGRWAS